MKRKLLSALICVAMVASVLTGCGGNGNDQAASAPATEQEAAPAETGGEEAAANCDIKAERLLRMQQMRRLPGQ